LDLLDLIFLKLKANFNSSPTSVGMLFSDLNLINAVDSNPDDLKHRIEATILSSKLVDLMESRITKTFKLSPSGYFTLQEHNWKYSSLKAKENEKRERKEIIERLEFNKLQDDVYKLQREVEDYDKMKSRTIRNERATIASAVLALIALLCQWLCNKSG
jgi:hypothetical protein